MSQKMTHVQIALLNDLRQSYRGESSIRFFVYSFGWIQAELTRSRHLDTLKQTS